MTTSFDLGGKLALVTGSSRGLGRGLALALADAGARLVIADLCSARTLRPRASGRVSGRRALRRRKFDDLGSLGCELISEIGVEGEVHDLPAFFGETGERRNQ